MVNISLTASMRSNLLSLQSIASQQDLVQNRLATGLKVSSAIDNPSSYYTAQSLNNRASDLTQLLDSMSQGIQTLKAVSETITSASKFLEQAKAVANQAMENTQPIVARVSSEADLQAALASDKRGLIVIDRDIVMSTNSNIVLKDGQSLVGAKYLDKTATQTSISFNFVGEAKNGIEVGNDSIISDLDLSVVTDNRGNKGVVYAEDKIGVILQQLNITMDTDAHTTSERDYFAGIFGGDNEIRGSVNIKDIGAVGNTNHWTVGVYRAIIHMNNNTQLNISTNSTYGFGIAESKTFTNNSSKINIDTNGNNGYGIWGGSVTLNNDSQLNINTSELGAYGIDYAKIYLNQSSTINMSLLKSNISINHGFLLLNSSLSNINIVGNQSIINNVDISVVTGATISTKTGTYTATANEKVLIKGNDLNVTINGNNNKFNFDTKTSEVNDEFKNKFLDFDNYMTDSISKTAEDDKDIVKESYQYNSILNQFDMIIKDSSYKGINLLLGQSLKVNFNEDRSSKLDITGVNASTNGLGLNDAAWKNQNNVEASISELDSAISDLRQYASEFGNYYSIVSNREEFTNNLVNVLTEGVDKLTLADMNQESANMLALQTAQSLAINSLSLASQASQSILKLF